MSTNTPTAQEWASLHFEVRQGQWSGFHRSFRQLHGRGDRHQIWEIWVDGDRYFTRHGKLGGKLQETNKVGKAKNVGQANELTPEMDAIAEARRLARKKWDFEGYDEFVGDINVDNRSAGTDAEGNKILPSVPHLLSSLPGSFCMYKPQNNMIEDCKALTEKALKGECFYTLKRNGLAMWVVVGGSGEVTMYSRRNRPSHKNEGPTEQADGTLTFDEVVPWTNRFPHLVAAVKALNLLPYSMMACELVSSEGDEKKHFAHVQGVEKSLTPAAIEKQEKNGKLALYWWDIPFYGGQDLVTHQPVGYRYNLIQEFTNGLRASRPDLKDIITPVQLMTFHNPNKAIEYAKEHNLEGFVVVDPEGVYGDRGWNLKGKPDRPRKFCAKLKPYWEDDFVAMWDPENNIGTYGKGKHEQGKQVTLPSGEVVRHGGLGSVGLFQYNHDASELVYISDCSSGMSYEFQASLSAKDFPFVCEIKYFDRSYTSAGDPTDALTFPVFVRPRTDKKPEECISDQL